MARYEAPMVSDVRYWLKADIDLCSANVRFRGKADITTDREGCLRMIANVREQCQLAALCVGIAVGIGQTRRSGSRGVSMPYALIAAPPLAPRNRL